MGQHWTSLLGAVGGSNSSSSRRTLRLSAEAPPAQSEAAAEAFEAAQAALKRCQDSIDYLSSYTGNDALVKKVVSTTDEDERAEALAAMLPNIEAIKGFYEMAQELEVVAASVLTELTAQARGGDVTSADAALVTALAQLLETAFLFDWAKMSHPAVQNDFSFFRRELAKRQRQSLGVVADEDGFGATGGGGGGAARKVKSPLSDAEASNISMFVAQGSPLLHLLSSSLAPQARRDAQLAAALADLATVAAATLLRASRPPRRSISGTLVLEKPEQQDLGAEERQTLALAAVEAAVLYDWVSPSGLFVKGSPVDVKRLVAAVKAWDGDLSTPALSALQFSSRTFKANASGTLQRLFT